MTQPTHGEVIAWIAARDNHLLQERVKVSRSNFGPELDQKLKEIEIAMAQNLANRDVLERHKPDSHGGECQHCLSMQGCCCCADISCAYPCPTYLDILQRIAEVM